MLMKKLLIALLGINALLVALLTAQAAQAKVKTYDAVKLAQYEECLELATDLASEQATFNESSVSFHHNQVIAFCFKYKP